MRYVVPHPSALAATILSAAHCASRVPTESPVTPARPTVDPGRVWPEGSPRTVLVLGAGGIPGVAWQAATLEGLAATGQLDPAETPVVIGTSAGSLVAMLLRSGLTPHSIAELVANGYVHEGQWEVSLPGYAQSADNPWRRRRLEHGSATEGPLDKLREDIDSLWHSNCPGTTWPALTTWIVATDGQTGERVVLGGPGAPSASPGLAVAASCAMPVLLSPVTIDGRVLVDGAMSSFTSFDLALMLEPDEVFVLDPAASNGMQWTWDPRGLAVSAARSAHGHLLERQVKAARERGEKVNLLRPSAQELDAMGTDLLDIQRCRAVVEVTRKAWQA